MQVVQDQDDRHSVGGQDRGNPSRQSLHVVVGDDPPEVGGRPLADDRSDRGGDRGPQGPYVILGRAEGDPCRGPARSAALGQHELASSVFPQPAGAAISALEDCRPAVSRACRRGRGTRCAAIGTANLPSQSAAPAARSAAPTAAAELPPFLTPGA
jgi:hypothetical protein